MHRRNAKLKKQHSFPPEHHELNTEANTEAKSVNFQSSPSVFDHRSIQTSPINRLSSNSAQTSPILSKIRTKSATSSSQTSIQSKSVNLQVGSKTKNTCTSPLKGARYWSAPGNNNTVSLTFNLKQSVYSQTFSPNITSSDVQTSPIRVSDDKMTYLSQLKELQENAEEIIRLRLKLSLQENKIQEFEHLQSVSGKLDDMENRLKHIKDNSKNSNLKVFENGSDGTVYEQLSSLVSNPNRTDSDQTKLTQMLKALGIDSNESIKERYILELKDRNKLLIRLSQQLDKKLGVSTPNISTFSELRETLLEKMELVMSLIDLSNNMRLEKEYFQNFNVEVLE